MPAQTDKLAAAIERIDAENARDPRAETVGGVDRPKELVYAERMTGWLDRLAPDAPEALRIATRAQHVRRWDIPRDSYPTGRAAYKRWRTDLGKHHADVTERILREVGYDEATIRRVRDLLQKKQLKADPLTQTLEDVIALTFIKHYLADFVEQHEHEYEPAKMKRIIQRTWMKMSEEGRQFALANLDLPTKAQRWVDAALAEADRG